MTRLRRLWQSNLDLRTGLALTLRHSLRPDVVEQLDTGDRAPVLLLPGVYETWHFMLPVARILNQRGHPIVVVPGLGHNQMPIPDAAALAQRHLDHRGLTGVIVVAHSKGGLIGKHMMAVDDASHRIASMVAIVTPFSGSSLASFAPIRTLKAFHPGDETLALLTGNREINARITSIFGEFDPMIPARSHLEGATNVELPIIGHFRILDDPRVLDAVLTAVGAE